MIITYVCCRASNAILCTFGLLHCISSPKSYIPKIILSSGWSSNFSECCGKIRTQHNDPAWNRLMLLEPIWNKLYFFQKQKKKITKIHLIDHELKTRCDLIWNLKGRKRENTWFWQLIPLKISSTIWSTTLHVPNARPSRPFHHGDGSMPWRESGRKCPLHVKAFG